MYLSLCLHVSVCALLPLLLCVSVFHKRGGGGTDAPGPVGRGGARVYDVRILCLNTKLRDYI